jgi:hypothetical protein
MARKRHPVARIPCTDGVERDVFQDKDGQFLCTNFFQDSENRRGDSAPDVAFRVKAVTGNRKRLVAHTLVGWARQRKGHYR